MNVHRPLLSVAPCARRCFVALALLVGLAANAATPFIFTHTKAALPGDIVVLHGANFVQGTNQPEVWLDRITGSTDTPDPETLASDIISSSDTLIHVRIPSNLGTGLYALFVKCNGYTSSHVWINQADAWQTLDIAGTQINPGRPFRLYGWNLDLPGATPKVWFKNTVTNVLTAARVTNVDRINFLTLTAPASLTPGQSYQLVVSNGYGGTYGETTGPTLACVATPSDPLGLGVPWAGGYSFTGNVYNVKTDVRLPVHAVGDGITDDTLAIQDALDRAFNDNGGVVYLPAGSYKVTSKLLINKRTVVRGDGMSGVNATKVLGILQRKTAHGTLGSNVFVGVMDLEAVEVGLGGGPGPAFLLRVKAESNLGQVVGMGSIGSSALIKDCEITSFATTGKYVFSCAGTANVLMKNTSIRWTDGRIWAGSASNIQIENCTFSRTVATDVGGPYEYGGWAFDAVTNLAFFDNTFQKIGSGVIPDSNDGEAILNQAVPRLGAGSVTGATSTTLSDSTESWTTNELTTAGAYAVILDGPGEGQWRKIVSHTATTVTLDTPWDVIPTTASTYTITAANDHWLIAGNTFNDCKRTIMLYSCTMRDVAIVDNDLINCFEINLRSDQRLADSPRSRFNVFKNVLIQGNDMINTNHVYATQLSFTGAVPAGETRIGNGFWDVVARKNILDTIRPNLASSNSYGVKGEGYFAIGVGPGASLQGTSALKGVLFDRNEAYNLDKAYHTSSGGLQTTIWTGPMSNIGEIWSNTTNTGATQGALSTTVSREAETGTLTNANVGNDSNASNGQFVSFLNLSTAAVQISNVDGGLAGGAATLTIRYATVGANPVKNLYVNGVLVGTVTFPATPAWTSYATVKTTVNLSAGSGNTIKISSTATDNKGLRIDTLSVTVP